MDLPELKNHVMRAIGSLYARDSCLLSHDAAEWAIAHRLAVYLEQELPWWNVDCEYNRQGPETAPKTDEKGKKIRPDIVIHHRGQKEIQHNLLVIELKKAQSDADHEKACEYTREPEGTRTFQYQYGLALSLSGDELRFSWFRSGKKVS